MGAIVAATEHRDAETPSVAFQEKKLFRCLGASVCRGGRGCRTWLVATALVVWVSPGFGQQLLDRVVARVSGEVITLTDVKAAVALGVVEVPADADEIEAIERLVGRQLVLGEVARFALPQPSAADVARETATLIAHAGSRLDAVMESTGIDEARIREMARDNLRIQVYLDQRFGTTAQLTEEEVAQYYRIHPDEFTHDGTLMPFTLVEPVARERAGAERRASTVARWMRDLRARGDVAVMLPRPPPAAPPAR